MSKLEASPGVGVPQIDPSRVIRTLVVDDSAFVRKVVREMLSASVQIEVVGVARDGEEGLRLAEELLPDVITCDLMMPQLDGLGFVRRQMERRPVPILLLSASPADGDKVIEALNAGAVDFVRKPTALATEELLNIRGELVQKVKEAARAPVQRLAAARASLPTPVEARPRRGPGRVDAVVLGISTGGPQALRQLLPQLPSDLPVPLVIVLHMPIGYTAMFAEKLDEISQLSVSEARDGDLVVPAHAILAQAGQHLSLARGSDGAVRTRLSLEPREKIHRPAVDVLFQSAAETFGGRVLAVVMTGMGDDGCLGAGWIKAQGGTVLTEAEESCVIYGMPRSVVEAGLSDAEIPLPMMARAIIERL